MQHAIVSVTLAMTLGAGAAALSAAVDVDLLATVHITQAVLAGGKPLPPGQYEIRLATGGPAPLTGQSLGAQR